MQTWRYSDGIAQEFHEGGRHLVDHDGDHLSPVPSRTDIGDILHDECDSGDEYSQPQIQP